MFQILKRTDEGITVLATNLTLAEARVRIGKMDQESQHVWVSGPARLEVKEVK